MEGFGGHQSLLEVASNDHILQPAEGTECICMCVYGNFIVTRWQPFLWEYIKLGRLDNSPSIKHCFEIKRPHWYRV